MPITSINNHIWNNVSRVNGLAIASVGAINGTLTPSVSFVTENLIGFWDPADVASRQPYILNNSLSSSWNLAGDYTSSVYTNGGSGSLIYVNGATITNFSSASINTDVFYFDGVNDYMALRPLDNPTPDDNPSKITLLLNYTCEMWIRSNGGWVNGGNFWSAAYNNGTRTRVDSSGNMWVYAPNVNSGNLGGVFATNTWHHFVVTMANLGANDRLRVYKNGVQTGEDLVGNYNPSLALSEFLVGTYNSTSEFQRFYMGIVRRYNRELTATEVQQNFDSEKSRYGY